MMDCFLLFCLTVLVSTSRLSLGQLEELAQRQCEREEAIRLPSKGECLVADTTAVDWVKAQSTCEQSGGSLYQTPDGRLNLDDKVLLCLANYPSTRFDNLWLDAVGTYSRQFFWVSGEYINKISYCSTGVPTVITNNTTCSETLSVDYCASTCYPRSVVLFKKADETCCQCFDDLNNDRVDCSDGLRFNWREADISFVVSNSETGLHLQLPSSYEPTKTDVLCGAIDEDTVDNDIIYTNVCSRKFGFLCDLGSAENCANLPCNTRACSSVVDNKCMYWSVQLSSWWESRAQCLDRKGDLWEKFDAGDIQKIDKFIPAGLKFWVGAINYNFDYKAPSNIYTNIDRRREILKCGRMQLERDQNGEGNSPTKWYFGATECDAKKPFLCQYALASIDVGPDVPDIICPYADLSGSGVTQRLISDDDDSFPLAALLAGIAAALLLLACLFACCFYCCRGKRRRKWRERLAFIPFIAEPAPVIVGSVADFDTLSNRGRLANTSYVSDHGSQIGLVKAGYGLGNGGLMTSSYGEHNNSMFLQSKAGNSSNRSSINRKLMNSQNYLANNSSLDERGFSTASYSTMPTKSKEYMTLEGYMNIDDLDGVSLRGSLRGKPEVTLVTDNQDVNFTVNHAVSHGGLGLDRSRSSLEKTMEEITLPPSEGGMNISIPQRISEAKVISSIAN